MTDTPPEYIKNKLIVRTQDSYLIAEFYEHACTNEWHANEFLQLKIKPDPELQEIETISFKVLDLERNQVTSGDVDELMIPVSSIVWMTTSAGCNYPPFRNQERLR